MNTGYVYKITDQSNTLTYVGSTCNFKRRISQHKTSYNSGTKYNTRAKVLFDAFGFDNCIFSIIE